MKTKKEIIEYFSALICAITAGLLILIYLQLVPTTSPSLMNLFIESIPSAIVVLMTVPVVYFLIKQRGLTEDVGSSHEIAQRVVDSIVQFLKNPSNGTEIVYHYIDGEAEAMRALTQATLRAKREVRATRFFPMAIRENHPDYAEAIRTKVLGLNGNEAVDRYYRIVAVNKPEKLNDCLEYITNFKGKPFILYLVGFSNDFEIVIIDDNETFIHFYGDQKIISSTLHLKGIEVTSRFKSVFTRLHEPKGGKVVLKVDLKYITTRQQVQEKTEEVEKFFEEQINLRKKWRKPNMEKQNKSAEVTS